MPKNLTCFIFFLKSQKPFLSRQIKDFLHLCIDHTSQSDHFINNPAHMYYIKLRLFTEITYFFIPQFQAEDCSGIVLRAEEGVSLNLVAKDGLRF